MSNYNTYNFVHKCYLRILTGKKHREMKLQRLQKVQIWAFGLLVQKSTLYKRFLNWNKIFKKIKQLLAKIRFLRQVHFVVTILFVLTFASDMTIFYGNDAFSILVLSTKKLYSSFLKKVFVFHKIFFKVKLSKMFKVFSDSHIKTCRSLKQRAILKTRNTNFQKNLCSFCWL